MSNRLLIVDDEGSVRAFLSDLYRREGYEVEAAADVAEAHSHLESTTFDLVLTDIMMPDVDGLEFLQSLRERDEALPVVLITGHPSMETAIEGLRLGAADYITKPFTPEELRLVARRILENKMLKAENRRLKEQISQRYEKRIVTDSPKMAEVMSLVDRVAATDSAVLITGESGVGKEGVAKALHYKSERQARPFVAINCGAISEGLIESELFGHVRGAFTGADREHDGVFVRAHESTLLLDEIGELPTSLQPKLLRVLQSGEVQPVGANATRQVDVRILASTNRDLEAEVKAGRFREDLFYRLNVIRIHVPPLRERREDIPGLIERFLVKFSAKRPGAPRRLSKDAQVFLEGYDWPGNVRELENAIERAVVLGGGGELDRADFAFLSSHPRSNPQVGTNGYAFSGLSLSELERLHIRHIVEACEGNRSAAARILGIDRSTLWKKLKEMG